MKLTPPKIGRDVIPAVPTDRELHAQLLRLQATDTFSPESLAILASQQKQPGELKPSEPQ